MLAQHGFVFSLPSLSCSAVGTGWREIRWMDGDAVITA